MALEFNNPLNLGNKKSDNKTETTKSEAVGANTRNDMFKKVCALIPGKISNKTVVEAFELMRKGQGLGKKSFPENATKNEKNFALHKEKLDKAKGYVEDQNNWKDLAYGESTMQYSGCEIFATFNAIYNITGKHTIPLHKMITQYESDGMVLSGKFGTAPKAIVDFLNKNGFKAEMTTEESEFDAMGKKSGSLILTMYNDKEDISKEVHTVNISKENGKYTAHNVYCNGKVVGPYATVTEVIKNINGGKAKGISLIGVNKK